MESPPRNERSPEEEFEAREFASTISPEELRSGEWFGKLVHLALNTYWKKVDAAYFQQKYPGLPPDAIVDRRIDLAKRYAAIEGATTAAAYAGVFAATIGSHGGAAPVTIPVAIAAIGVDVVSTSYLQLRLAYDISVLYGKPLDFEDAEDLHDLLVLAFGVKAGEVFHEGLQRLAPEGVRVLIKKTVTGARLEWLKALPVVGKYLLQRNIIKLAIPVVSVPLGAGVNYLCTGAIGQRAKEMFRLRQAIEEAADKVSVEPLELGPVLLKTIWLLIKADGKVTQEEVLYLRRLVAAMEELGDPENARVLREMINFDADTVVQELSDLPAETRTEIYEAACVASVVDGKATKREMNLLRTLADTCDCSFDKDALEKLAKELRGEQTAD